MSIDVGFCFYETEIDTVRRVIESIKDHVDRIIAVDGKFDMFDSPDELSPDNVRDYLKSVPNVVLIDAPNLSEPRKRDIYLENTSADFLLIVDADEWVEEDEMGWNYFHERINQIKVDNPAIFTVKYTGKHGNVWNIPKLWYQPNKWRYTKCHNFFENTVNGRIIRSSPNHQVIDGIIFYHDDTQRSEKYLKDSYDYQLKLISHEKPIKQQYLG